MSVESIASLPGFADIVLRPTGILLVAAVLAFAMRRLSAASRHLLWSTALCAILAVPFLGPLAPDIGVRMSPEITGMIERAAPSWASVPKPNGDGPTLVRGRSVAAERAERTEGSARVPAYGSGPMPWRAIWLIGALGLSLVLGVRLVSLRRVERSGTEAKDPGLLDTLASAKRRLEVDSPVRLLLGEPAAMPMTWGHRAPRILLPATAVDWPSEQTRAVLLHELAHVKRGDVLLQRIAEVTLAVFWFNPLAWYAVRRMLAEREHACDDAVISAGIRGSDYADQLLAMTHSLRSARGVAAGLPMARRSQMTGRLLAILDERRSRRPLPASVAKLTLGLGLAAGLAIGALRPVPLDATIARDLESAADRTAETPPRQIMPPPAAGSLPGVSNCRPAAGSNTNTNRNRDPGVITAEWRTERCEGGLEIVGRAVLRFDSTDFARLDPGTRVKMGEREQGGAWLKIELAGMPEGRIERRGHHGEAEIGAGQIDAWLASNLASILRLTSVELEVAEGSP